MANSKRKEGTKKVEDAEYDVASGKDLRLKYKIDLMHYRKIRLEPEHVPDNLKHLIPYAEAFGISDDLLRNDVINMTDEDSLRNLIKLVNESYKTINEWLGVVDPKTPEFSNEYIAFVNLRIAVDEATVHLKYKRT
jgi:hypothetical protein